MLFTFHESVPEGYRILANDTHVLISAGESSITLSRNQLDALFFAIESFYADEEVTKQLEEANANSEERN
jgi:hypothetical protein